MSEAPADLLVETRILPRQGDPWAQRVAPDGEVWQYSSIDTRIEDGQVVQTPVPLEWRRLTRLDGEGLAMIEERLRDGGFFALDPDHEPSRPTSGRAEVVWRAMLDGREHEVRLHGADPAGVPPVADLDRALQLAIAMALDRESGTGARGD